MTHRIKILHVISSWESGRINELAEFAARLPKSEFENEICVLSGSKNRRILNVSTTTLSLRSFFDVSTFLGIRRVLRRFRPDIVHTWDSTSQSYAALQPGTQRILAEKREPYCPKGWLQNYVHQKTSRYIVSHDNNATPNTTVIPPAAVPVPYAEPVPAEELLTQLGFPLVEPSGNYYPVFQSQYDPQRHNYKPLNGKPPVYLIGMVLPLDKEHRILDALWVFETFNHVHLNYHVFIIGDGKDRNMFLRCRDQWKLFSRVHFLGNRSDAHRLLPSFDVLLHLSPSAEVSDSILSAMSCGVPVVALETPESRDYILDGTTGILIPSKGDFRFYRRTATKSLLYLLENVELRRSMQRAAKERVTAQFNFETAVQQRVQVYRELASGLENNTP